MASDSISDVYSTRRRVKQHTSTRENNEPFLMRQNRQNKSKKWRKLSHLKDYIILVLAATACFFINNKFIHKIAQQEKKTPEKTPEVASPPLLNTTRRKFILHIGPGKMGTTTIQDAIGSDHKELLMDNYCVFDQKKFTSVSMYLNSAVAYALPGTKEEKIVKEQYLKAMIDHFDQCYNMNRGVLLSSEFLGHLEKDRWEDELLKPASLDDRWDIFIAVGYRRFYSWARSVWFQNMRLRVRRDWPENEDMEVLSFHDWYSQHKDNFLVKLYTDYYINHWRGLGINNFLIYNMHEDPNLLKEFYCSVLGLEHSCKKHLVNNNNTTKSNVGHSIQHDRLACTLYSRGYVNTTKINRLEAGKIILDFFDEKNTTLEQVSQSCFTDDELNEVLLRSKTVEQELLPDFHAGSKGFVTMADEFEDIKNKSFCDVNIDYVIEQHGEELRSLFV